MAPEAVSLMTVVVTLAGGWLITNRVTDHWDKIKKNREMNLAAAQEFQRLYGEVIAICKTWNALNSEYTAAFATPGDTAKWDCLMRATAAEGEIESLMAKLAADRLLSDEDINMLGSLRQGFKAVRRKIRADKPIEWSSSGNFEYAAFKSLAASMSVLLTAKPAQKRLPSTVQAAAAFKEITANRHEKSWTDGARPRSLA